MNTGNLGTNRCPICGFWLTTSTKGETNIPCEHHAESKTTGITASEAWDRLCVQLADEMLSTKAMGNSVRFYGSPDFMYMSCGDVGCCEGWWTTKEAFVEAFRDATFEVRV
jgi:hypothetical protein